MAKKASIGKKFLGKKLLSPDSFTFEWRVFRYKNQDWRAIEKDMVKSGLDKKISRSLDTLNEEKCKIQMRKIFTKHTKKWYTYSLYRHCHQQDEVVKAMATLMKHDKAAFAEVKSSANYKLFQDVLAAEEKKNRKFSSLAAMQRYADKHDLGIDVYSLMEMNNTKEK